MNLSSWTYHVTSNANKECSWNYHVQMIHSELLITFNKTLKTFCHCWLDSLSLFLFSNNFFSILLSKSQYQFINSIIIKILYLFYKKFCLPLYRTNIESVLKSYLVSFSFEKTSQKIASILTIYTPNLCYRTFSRTFFVFFRSRTCLVDI